MNKIIDSVFPQVSTNFTLAEMIGYAKDFQKYTIGESMGFPENNTTDMLNVVGSVVIPSTLSSNVADVHRFLFGNDGYQVSSKISQIEGGIAAKAADRSTGTVSDDDDVYYRQDYDLGDDDYDYDDDSGSYGNDDDGGGDDTEDGSGGGIEGDAGGDGESYPDEGVE